MPEKWVPVIAYARESTVDALRPLIDEIGAAIERGAPRAAAFARTGLGVTVEMLAWGKLLDACAEAEAELEVAVEPDLGAF